MATITKEVSGDGAISAYGTARSTVKGTPLSPDELDKIDAYWRPSLYLCMGMLYLKDNPLLREALRLEHTKPRLLGHWGVRCRSMFHIHSLQSADQKVRPERDLYQRSRTRSRQRSSRRRISKALIPRYTPTR